MSLSYRFLAQFLAMLCAGLFSAAAPAMRQYTVRDGLGQNTVSAIAIDRQGFVWLGTEDGLRRFDGHEFKSFRHDPRRAGTLSNNGVTALLADGDTLWIGTFGGGVNRLDLRTEEVTALPVGAEPKGLSSPLVLALARTPDGDLWAATDGAGVNRVHFGAADGVPTVTHYRHREDDPRSLPSDRVWGLRVGPSGLWIATLSGVALLRPGATLLESPQLPTGAADLAHENVEEVFEESDGTLWLGSWVSGLYRIDASRREARRYAPSLADAESMPSARIASLERDASGRLWIGTDAGMAFYERACDCVLNLSLDLQNRNDTQGLFISALAVDRSGGVWAGTYGEGLLRIPAIERLLARQRYQREHETGLAQGRVRALLEDQSGDLWVATLGGSLQRVAAQHRQPGQIWTFETMAVPRPDAQISGHRLWSLLEDRQRRLWVAGEAGLARLDAERRDWRYFPANTRDSQSLPSGSIRALLASRDGRVWVGSSGGLAVVDAEDKVHRIAYSNDPVWAEVDRRIQALEQDAQGRIWIGSAGGLHILSVNGEHLRTLRGAMAEGGQPGSVIYDIYVHGDGSLWVAGNGGLCVSARTADLDQLTWRCASEADGMPNGVVYGLERGSDGALWLGTGGGLVRIEPDTLACTTYYESDGLVSEDYAPNAHAAGRDGNLYFGTVDGLLAFDPRLLPPLGEPPQVMLTGFELGNRQVEPRQALTDGRVILRETPAYTASISLDHTDRLFGFRLSAFDFDRPATLTYAYQLVGFDPDWLLAGTRPTLSYTNVPAGDYVLRARARDSNGRWGAARDVVRIDIRPPFWEATWFRVSVGLCGALLAWLALRLRLRSLRLRQHWLEAEVATRTVELEAQKTELAEAAQALKQANEQLFELSTRDALTGVFNRRHVLLRGEALAANADREHRVLSCALIDLDHFKQVNDRHGHAAGDAVLRDFAQLLTEVCSVGDLAGRYGGEEFIVFLEGRDRAAAQAWADELSERVRCHRINWAGQALTLTISTGLATRPAGTTLTLENWIAQADAALYRAKDAGRDRVAVA